MNEPFDVAFHRFAISFDTLRVEMDALKRLQVETAVNEILESRKLNAEMKLAILARAWIHTLAARSGCTLSLCKGLFAHSQCSRIRGQRTS